MRIRCAGISATGPMKAINQDAYLIKRAQTAVGEVALAVVADGLGGLERGERASSELVRAFEKWFERDLPLALESLGSDAAAFESAVRAQWLGLAQQVNLQLMRFGNAEGISLGTTCTALLVFDARYLVMQVGDSRLYAIDQHECCQLTQDQTFAAQEVAAGRIAPEEVAQSRRDAALLQCVGASRRLEPVLFSGEVDFAATYLLCTDGLHHVLAEGELQTFLAPEALGDVYAEAAAVGVPPRLAQETGELSEGAQSDRRSWKDCLQTLIDVVYARGEHDNATVVVLRATQVGGAACLR